MVKTSRVQGSPFLLIVIVLILAINSVAFVHGIASDYGRGRDLQHSQHSTAGGTINNATNSGKEQSYVEEQTDCTPDDARYEYMLALPGDIKFYWTLDTSSDSIDIQLSHLGSAWLALGIAQNESGEMINSDAIICRPALSAAIDEKPLKYHLSSKSQIGVYPMDSSRQTLTDASCSQDDDETILRFTKKIQEDGENPISKTNSTTFLYAVGEGNILSRHAFTNSFNLDVSKCPIDTSNIVNDRNYTPFWITHGVFGTLAFAVALPSSITAAFLRPLIPTSWIFVHVYGNLLAFILTSITFFIAVSTMSKSGGEHFTESHHKIGISLLLLSLFQIVGGVFRPDKPTRQSNIQHPFHIRKRNIWKWFHHVLGISILSLGLYQVGDGLSMYAEDYETYSLAPVYFVVLAICISIVAGTKLWLSVFGEGGRTFEGGGADTEVENLQQNSSRFPETEMI